MKKGGISLKKIILFLLSFLVLSYQVSLSQVAISEVMFDPSGPENTDEFIEICNLSPSETVDLQGWRLGDGTGDDRLKDTGKGLLLCPNQYAVILDPDYFGQSASYDSLIPPDALILTVDGSTLGSAGLSNSKSETVMILDATGQIADSCAYSIGNQPGYSDERIDLSLPNTPDNWADSRIHLGTPGFKNSVVKAQNNLKVMHLYYKEMQSGALLFASVINDGKSVVSGFTVQFYSDSDLDSVLEENEEIGSTLIGNALLPGDSTVLSIPWEVSPGTHGIGAKLAFDGDEKPEDNVRYGKISISYPSSALLINEIMYDPLTGDCEWIEVFNPLSSTADLIGWTLSDQDTLRRYIVSLKSFPVPSGDYAVLAEDLSFLKQHTDLEEKTVILSKFPNLNNDSDDVVLYDPAGRLMDRVAYSTGWGGGNGVSLERIDPRRPFSDSDNWHSSASPSGATPGERNSFYIEAKTVGGSFSVEPNPFSPDGDGMDDTAIISYNLPFEIAYIHLRIFDVRGRVIRNLERGRLSGKDGRILWKGRDDQNQPVPIGQYIVFLEAAAEKGGKMESYRAVLVLAGAL